MIYCITLYGSQIDKNCCHKKNRVADEFIIKPAPTAIVLLAATGAGVLGCVIFDLLRHGCASA